MRNLTKFCKVGLAPFFSNKLPFFKAEAPFWILCYFQLVRLAYVLGRVDTFAHNSLEFQMRKVLDFAKKKYFLFCKVRVCETSFSRGLGTKGTKSLKL